MKIMNQMKTEKRPESGGALTQWSPVDRIRQFIGLRTLKTAVAAGIAIFIATLIGLSYAANAGIIVILSVQNTKRRSSELARQRLVATLIALFLSSVVYRLIGFNPLAFAVYLLLFIPIAVRLKFHDAIVPCSVLVSHLLAVESVAPQWLLNEFLQMVIGAGMALLVNLHIPSHAVRIREDLDRVEDKQREFLRYLAHRLRQAAGSVGSAADHGLDGTKLLTELDQLWHQASHRVQQEAQNYPGEDCDRNLRYLEMRKGQYEVLRHLDKYVGRVRAQGLSVIKAAELTDRVADEVARIEGEPESAGLLWAYQEKFEAMDLPRTREEFVSQAALYDYISDLELLIELKRGYQTAADDPSEGQSAGA